MLLNPFGPAEDAEGRRHQVYSTVASRSCTVLELRCEGPEGTVVEAVHNIELEKGEHCRVVVSWPRAPWWRRPFERWLPTERPFVGVIVELT